MKDLIVTYHCLECDKKSQVKLTNKMVTCPHCGTINDVRLEGEDEPPRHKKMNKKFRKQNE